MIPRMPPPSIERIFFISFCVGGDIRFVLLIFVPLTTCIINTILATQELTTVETATELGLLPEEFERIVEILGRTPNFTELSIFSVMWSEHCSYKNSIVWLKTLPKDGPHMLAKAGEENAGLVDIGDGLGCAF